MSSSFAFKLPAESIVKSAADEFSSVESASVVPAIVESSNARSTAQSSVVDCHQSVNDHGSSVKRVVKLVKLTEDTAHDCCAENDASQHKMLCCDGEFGSACNNCASDCGGNTFAIVAMHNPIAATVVAVHSPYSQTLPQTPLHNSVIPPIY